MNIEIGNETLVNAGYFITKYEQYGSEEERKFYIVLGYNPKSNQYVTWDCVNLVSFFWGHYFDNETHALKDYHERLVEYFNRKPF